MIEALSPDRFHDLVAGYGADPERWPAERRGGAVSCLVESGAARAAWRDAAELDSELDSVPPKATSSDLMEKVIAIGGAAAERKADKSANTLRYVVPYAAAAAIALIVGLAVPSPFRAGTDASLDTQTAATVPLTSEEPGDDLAALALVDGDTFADETGVSNGAVNGESLLSALPLL